MNKHLPITLLSLLLVATVVLNGAHVKDVLNSFTDSQIGGTKVAADVHTHIDKQAHKIGSDVPQLDGRSLRLRDKRLNTTNLKGWLDSWRDHFALLVG